MTQYDEYDEYDELGYNTFDEHRLFTNAYREDLPDTDEMNSLILSTLHMTDYEMIDFVTDMYVDKLKPLNYVAIEMEDFVCERDVVFERLYDFS